MEYPAYIATNQDELFDKAPQEIRVLIESGEVDIATVSVSTVYKIPEESQAGLSDIVSFILIGALQANDIIEALQDLVGVTAEVAVKIATNLNDGIFKKANISLFKPADTTIATLEFQGTKSKEELRKEILDTTKRESALTKPPTSTGAKLLPKVITPGSRSQLLEQLQVLGSIPDDDEIEARLSHIQEQIAALKKQDEDNSLDSQIALKSFMFGEKGKTVADSSVIKTTYSVPPTKYTIDPYREVDPV